jgi:hypothetical protein
MFPDDKFLVGAELERVGSGQLAGEFGSHGFGGLAARGENEERAQIIGKGLSYEPWPVAADFGWDMVVEEVGANFFERNGAEIVPDEQGIAAQSLQPFDDVLRVGDAAAEQE